MITFCPFDKSSGDYPAFYMCNGNEDIDKAANTPARTMW
jgi:hypothetical protein